MGIPVKHITAEIISLPPSKLLQGRNALITGGTSGIGFKIASSFIKAGASVVITGRNEERVYAATKKIAESTKTPKIYGIVLDNTNISGYTKGISEVEKLLGTHIDILVNNAGVFNCNAFGSTLEKEWDDILNTNLKGAYFLSQFVAKRMVENHIKGNILNIASSSGLRPANSPYSLSKWGIRGLTEGMARVLTKHDIVVNGIAPGPTATPMLMGGVWDGNIAHERNPTGRHAVPEEIANMSVILVSGMGRMIVGDIVYMTGGAGNVTNEDLDFKFNM